MRISGRGWARVTCGTVVAVTLFSCRPADAPVEELFRLRTEGLAYLQYGQLPEAEEQFQRLVDLVPDDPFGHANLGLTYLRGGRFEEAEAPLRRARRLDPANPEIGLILAKLYSLTSRPEEARELLEELRNGSPGDASVAYALAELEAQASDSASALRREDRLREVLAGVPTNLAARVQLAGALLRRGEADSVIQHLEEIRRIPPALPQEAATLLQDVIDRLRAGDLSGAALPFDRLSQELELTAPYQASLYAVGWVEGPLAGQPVLTFAPEDVTTMRALREAGAEPVRFADVTAEAGLPEGSVASAGAAVPSVGGEHRSAVLAVGDIDGDGSEDLFVAATQSTIAAAAGAAASPPAPGAPSGGARLYRVVGGQALEVTERAGITLPAGAIDAILADYDNDGWLDLFAIGGNGRGHLFRNGGNVTFQDVTATAGVTEVGDARTARFVDLDHDGDLDLLLVGPGGRKVYRNNLDGTFTESAAAFGLAGGGALDARFGDFDGDGRIDVVFSGSDGIALYVNQGAARFRDATATSGLRDAGGGGAALVADFDNDAALDLLVGGGTSGSPTLWRGNGDGSFSPDGRSAAVFRQVGGAASFELVDYDNDGWPDLLVAGSAGEVGGGVRLLRNQGDGQFVDQSAILPETSRSASCTGIADADEDGDQDIFVGDPAGLVRLLRNDGGNLNRAMRVELKALRTGSGKNNDFGIGARVEVRAGDVHQTRVVTGPVTHFGLGDRLKADVVRVEWPNGVMQLLYLPGSDQDILEAEKLKGSCAFLYTWDGERFRFVTDVMWRSALGMPLGLMATGTAFAPAGASQEYLRIPGEVLQPRDGRYVLQLTEELWETAYVDEIRLLAIDHPDSIDIFVDERFVPPGPVEMRLFRTARPRLPLAATDDRRTDLLPALRAADDVYVSNLNPLQYQGLVEPHDLILELDAQAGAPGSSLFLRGWIYPTDASINVALSQQSELAPIGLSLEVRDENGEWRTAIPNLGFPSGKDKTMVIGLEGIFPTADRGVRLRTNLQIYWDQAFVSNDLDAAPVRVTTLAPLSSELRYRGFSRPYRKGGRYGPHWFAYDDVSEESPWRPIEGAFTRFGDVLPLLRQPDDMYVVMGPGDETTVQFDASSADDLPPGWTRDFLLYTDGWIKDADMNTAHGNTVEPLPFHAIGQYPYGPDDAYPTDEAHARYLREYNTRRVGGEY